MTLFSSIASTLDRVFCLGLTVFLVGCTCTADQNKTTVSGATTAQNKTTASETTAALNHGELKSHFRPGELKSHFRPIDTHTHLHPLAISRIAWVMEQVGLDLMVNLSGGNQWNGGIRAWTEVQRRYPGKVVNCFNVDWNQLGRPDFGRIMARGLAAAVRIHGFRCLKISKALGLGVKDPGTGHLLAVDDHRLDPIWKMAGELGVPVFIHTGDPKAFFEPATPSNERYEELSVHPSWSFSDRSRFPSREALLAARDRVIARHPETNFIGVHFGGNPEDINYVERVLAKFPNFYVDIAARIGEIGRHAPQKVHNLFLKYQDRIIFGTDIGIGLRSLTLGSSGRYKPLMSDVRPFYALHFRFLESDERAIPHPIPVQGHWTVDAIGLPEDVLKKLYKTNVSRLLHM